MANYTREYDPRVEVDNLQKLVKSRCVLAYNFGMNNYGKYEGPEYGIVPQVPSHAFVYSRPGNVINFDGSGFFEELDANQPPFVRSGGRSASSGLLIEPASTNILEQSRQFDHISWVCTGSTIIRPNGSINIDQSGAAYKLVEDSSFGQHDVYTTVVIPQTTSECSVSVVVALDDLPDDRFISIALHNTTSKDDATAPYLVVVDNGGRLIWKQTSHAVVSVEPLASSQSLIPRRWFKITITQKLTLQSSSFAVGAKTFQISLVSAVQSGAYPFTRLYQGSTSAGVYLYGAQIERRIGSTSHILTTGSTASRSASKVQIPLTRYNFTLIEMVLTIPCGVTGLTADSILKLYNGSTEVDSINFGLIANNSIGLSGYTKPVAHTFGNLGVAMGSYTLNSMDYTPVRVLLYSSLTSESTVVIVDDIIVYHNNKALPQFDSIVVDGSGIACPIVVSELNAYEGDFGLKELVMINRVNRGEL